MLMNPRQTVYGAKRLVGRAFDIADRAGVPRRFHYEIVEGDGGAAAVASPAATSRSSRSPRSSWRDARDGRASARRPVSARSSPSPPTTTTTSARRCASAGRARGAQGRAHPQRAHRRGARFGYGRELEAGRSCTTSAAAPSTPRCSRSRATSTRWSPPAATRSSAASTSTTQHRRPPRLGVHGEARARACRRTACLAADPRRGRAREDRALRARRARRVHVPYLCT